MYRISRNPMYVGFHLMTLASILLHAHGLVIIFGEERFLRERFGDGYISYAKRVRGYL